MRKIMLGIIIILLIIGGVIFINKGFNTRISDDSKVKENDSIEEEDDKKKLLDEIIGRWDSVKAVNSEDAIEVNNLRDVFGSSYSQYGSYIEFNDDGTFVDKIVPITDGSKSNAGTYKVERDYNKPGDLYIFLTYDDGSEGKLEKVILDDSNVSYLVLENFVNGYQITFKKQ